MIVGPRNARQYYAKLRRGWRLPPKVSALGGHRRGDWVISKADFASELRGAMTCAEKRLWRELRGGGWSAQSVVCGYIPDFVHRAARIVVEVDGPVHDAQIGQDAERTRHLRRAGWTVVRYRNDEVLAGAGRIAATLHVAAASRRNTSKAQPACGMDLPPSHACQSERSDGTS